MTWLSSATRISGAPSVSAPVASRSPSGAARPVARTSSLGLVARPRAASRTRTCCRRRARCRRRSCRPSSRPAAPRSSGRARCRRSWRAVELSAWMKGWKSRASVCASMPMPVSVTSTRTRVPSSLRRGGDPHGRRRPRSVNLTALETRLMTTWRRRAASPRSQPGSSPSAATSSSMPFARATGEQHRAALGDRLAQREVGRRELDLAGLDLRVVEDVVDDQQQPLAGGAHDLRVLALLRVERRVEQQPGHADHAVERRAQLVADGRDEHRLRVRGLDRLVARERVARRGASQVAEREHQPHGDGDARSRRPAARRAGWCGGSGRRSGPRAPSRLSATGATMPASARPATRRLRSAAPRPRRRRARAPAARRCRAGRSAR